MRLKDMLNDREKYFVEIVNEFNNNILQKALEKVNNGDFKYMSAKLIEEKLPTNQRNLTDARTRIGTLLEYALAYEINIILNEEDLENYTMGYVLANQYPDLVLRDENHIPVLRLEVKSIQGVSEEKSANFDALVRNIKKNSDILCVILWEWEVIADEQENKEYPEIYDIFAFDAYELSRLRDESWLSTASYKEDLKLIDISGPYVPVNRSSRVKLYKTEEKNMGKLLRIDSEVDLMENEIMQTASRYADFKEEVIKFGLQEISLQTVENFEADKYAIKVQNFKIEELNLFYHAYREIDDKHLLVFGGNRQKKKKLNRTVGKFKEIEGIDLDIVVFNDKFRWDYYSYNNSEGLHKKGSGTKPQGAFDKVQYPI